MVLDMKTMVLGRKTNFFLGKTTTIKKPSFETLCGQMPKRLFFVFPRKRLVFHAKTIFPRKKLVFHAQTIFFFPRQKLVFLSKTIFLLRKNGFPVQNHLFPRENQNNHLFGVWPHSVSTDGFFGFP